MTTMTTPLSDTDLLALESAKVVDARGSACPGPLLEAKKAMNTVQIGQTIEIWSSDPGHQDRHRRLVGEGRPHVPRDRAGRGLRAHVRGAPEVVTAGPADAGPRRSSLR